jgi:hypothetical protein
VIASGVETAGRTLGLVLVVAATASCKYDELPRLGGDASLLRPCEMMVSDVTPTVLSEGMGAGGSRPALIVISGQNLVNANTVVTITAAEGATRTPMIEIDPATVEVGTSGTYLAVPVTLPVDAALPANEMITLDVTIEQDCPGDRVSGKVLGKLALKGLDELTDASAGPLQGGLREFSQIDVPTAQLVPAAGQTMPIVLRSMSSARITRSLALDAVGRTGGPAGGTGGAGGVGMGGLGAPGTGPSPGTSSGTPGGFDMTDPGLNTLNPPNRSSGGAGGNAAIIGNGGNGGGGGGSIEISAGGDLEVGAISARGAAGAAGSAGGSAGGGGSGGVIFLRAGGVLTAGNIDVRGGGAGGPGAGAPGRARYDAGGTATVSPGELGANHLRGPMFSERPFAVRTTRPELTILAKPLANFKYFVFTREGEASSLSTVLVGASGTARVMLSSDLSPGLNQICLITESGTQSSETSNCAHIAYLPD